MGNYNLNLAEMHRLGTNSVTVTLIEGKHREQQISHLHHV
jgi:hypothetical protein